MFLQKQISHFLGSALRRMNLILVLAVFSTSVSAVYTYTRTLTPEHAYAATSSNLNFQARLLSASGNTVPDGYYNIQFNLYSVSSGGSSLWTETRDFDGTDDRVRTVNGYLSVNLGSVNALPNIDWSQDLWLGMTVRGSATCAFATTCTPADSEMTPRTKLTAVPYALAAGNVRSANTTAASTNSDGVNITTGGASGATSNTGAITLQSGNSTTSGNTGGISLQSGNATSGNSGNITLDVGTASGTTGTISIGTANTSGITIGKVGVLTRVDGNFTIGASAGSGTQFTNNGSTLNATLAVLNDSDGGLLGGTPGSPLTAAQSVDIYTSVTINQTTAGQDISLQNPTSAAAGRIMYVLNIGTQSFTMHSVTIPAGYGQLYIWNGSNWRLAASGGGAAITLQAGYDGGNTITSTNGRDLSFTSADTATDANFLMNIATGSTGEFKVQANGTDVLQIGATGQLQLDVQGNTGGLLIGADANLYRSAADTLRTDDSLVVQGVLSTLRGSDYSTTGSLDNFNFGVSSLVRLTGASTQTITGIANGSDGRILTIVNAAAQTAYISNDSASSSAGNKIYTGTGSNLAIPAGSSITLIYDAGASYWRVVGGAATSSSGAGAPFVQGGNSFAANAVLGTNDTFPLIFRTNNADKLQLTTGGDLEFLAAATLQTNAGALTLDAATALNLGTTDATSVSISRTGQATTVNGSLNVVQNFSVNTSQFTVDASNGNTVVAGTLTVGSGATDNDTLRIIGNTTLPTPTGAGHIFYNQTNGELYIYDGTRWQTDRSTATYIVAASDSINKDKADYVADGTDDQDTINAAINALPASPRGIVFLLEGTYNIDDGADNDDEGVEVDKGGTILAGSGPSTYLKNVNGINTNFETVSSNAVSNVTIRDLQIDGNRTNQTAGSQYGIDITGLGSGAGTTAVPGVIIQNVQVKDVRTTGIRLTSTTLNSLVTGTRVVNSGTYGLEIGTSSVRNTITDSYFQGNGDVGVRIASSDNAITNNTVETNTNQGIYTLSDRTLIAGNTLRGNGSGVNDSAILVNGAVGSQVTGNNISTGYVGIEIYSADSSTVTGNTVSSTSNIGIFVHVGASRTNISGNSVYAAGSDGISINTSDYSNISGNIVDTSTANGIHLDSNVDYASVTSNFVYNSAGAGSSDGIFVNNSTTNNQITGNKITDTAGTGCAIDFATGTPATNTYLADNTYSGTGAASICNIPSTTIQAGQVNSSNVFVIQGTAGVALNDGTVTSTATTFNFLQSNVTTLNMAGAATDINIGPTGSGASTIDFSGGSADTGCTIDGSNGNLVCSGTITSAGESLSLQGAYDLGNTILSTNARNIDITLADTATDANLVINVASGSTGELKVQSSGTDVLQIGAAGQLQLDVQGNTGGLLIGTDAQLYRSAIDTLRTPDALVVDGAFTGSLGATISGAAISLNGSSNFATSINGGTSTGSVSIGNAAAGAVTLQSGSAGGNQDIILNSADTIELQDTTNVTGSLTVSVNADIAGTLAVGTADAVTISAAGLITTADDIAINGGDLTTSAGTFNLLNGATTVNLGSTAIARTINLGTGAAAQTVNIGSTNSTSTTNINAGSGGIVLSGNTSIANNSSFTIGTGSQFTNNSSTLLTAITNADTATDTDIGTAAATVNIATTINKTQTTAGRTLTLPTPTSATAGRVVYINSVAASTQSFTMYGVVIAPSTSASFIWNGATWVATGGGSGVNTIGAVDTTPTTANGARISGSTLYLQYADATYAGLISATTQTLAGNKTFNGVVTLAAAGTALSVTNNADIGGTLAVGTADALTIAATGNLTTAGDIAVNGGDITSTGALNITPGGALAVGATGQTLTLQGSVTTITSNGAGNDIILDSADIIALQDDVTLAAGKSLTLTGGNTASRPGSPTDGMVYYDTTTKQLLTYANGKWQADRSTATKIVAASNSSQAIKDAADYVADGTGDQTEINSALTAATGGKVYLAEGTYTLSGAISIPSNTGLNGSGAGTLITIGNAAANFCSIQNADTVSGNSRINLSNFRLDGNMANNGTGDQSGICLYKVGSGTGVSAIKGATIESVQIENYISDALYISEGANNFVASNTMVNSGFYGINVQQSTNNIISNNAAHGNNRGINLYQATGNTIEGNLLEGSTVYGLSLNVTSNNNSVTNNTVVGNVSNGIRLSSSSSNSVANNKVHDNGGATANNGIFLTGADNNSIIGNSITDTACTTTCYAINISDATSDKNYLEANRYSGSAANAASINDAGTGTIYVGQSTNATTSTNSDVTSFLFRGSNSTTAFRIQNANGTSTPFSVNTTTPGVTIAGTFASAGGAISLNDSSNFATSINGGTSTGSVSIGNAAAGAISLQSNDATANAIVLNASNAAGGIDIDAGTNGITLDTTGAISLDSTAIASNFGLTANSGSNAVLTFSATNAGAGTAAITLTADETINLNAPTWQRTAAGTTTINLSDGSNTTLAVINSGAGTASLSVDGSGTFATGLTVTAGPTSLTGLAAGSSTAASINTGATSNVGLNIQGVASQTSNLLQVQDSTGASLNRIDAGGNQENLGYINTPSGGFGPYSNLIVGSERFDTGIWARTNVSAPASNTIVAPNGTTTAESLATSSSGGFIRTDSGTAPTNNNYTFSVWLKSPSGTQNVDLQIVGSTGGTTTVQTVTTHTTWERFWVTRNTNGLTGVLRVQIYPGTAGGTGTVHAWGAQLVLASTPQVYAFSGNDYVAATQGAVVNGDALFVANTISATAFRIQDVNNNNIFGIDTSSSTAYAISLGATGANQQASTVNINTTSNATGTQIINAGSSAKAANAINLLSGSTGGINLNVSTNSPTNINTGTSTGAVSIGNSAAGIISLQSGNATAGAIVLNASNAAGGIDIDAGTNGITLDTTGAISLDSTAIASNFGLTANSASNAVLTISASNAGAGTAAITLAADETINLNAGTVVGTATTQNLFNTTATTINFGGAATTLNIGPTGSGASSILLSGGSADTGCTINGATGDLVCSGNITGAATGTVGYFSRSGTTLQPATAGDNIQTTSSGTITSAGLLTGQSGLTVTGAAVNLNASSNFDTNINTGTSTGAVNIGNSVAGAITMQSGSSVGITSGTTLSLTSIGANSINITPGGGSNTGVVIKPTSNSTAAFQIQKADGTDVFTADTTNSQLSVRGINSASVINGELFSAGSCTGTNWSGTGPWTHTTGSTVALVCTPPASLTAGATYVVEFDVTGSPTAGENVTPQIGGTNGRLIYGNVTDQKQVLTATNTNSFRFTPTSNWNGSITNISFKLITTTNTVLTVLNSDASTGLEVRSGGTGLLNTFVGASAGRTNFDGIQNTALGVSALQSNTSGNNNTAIGRAALLYNTVGSGNMALGTNALLSNTTGNDNVAMGISGLLVNTTGSRNITQGGLAFSGNTTGSNNVGIGYQAGTTSVGGNANTTGSNNTFIGYNSGPGSSTQLQNATAVGTYSIVTQDNSLILGCINGTNGCTAATRVGVGTATPAALLHINALSGGTDPLFRITDNTATARDVVNVADGGAVTLRNQTDSAAALQIQNAAGTIQLNIDTTNGNLTATGDIAVNGGDITTTSGAATLFNGANPTTIGIGSDANAKTITVGNTTLASALNLRVGTGNFTLDGVAASTFAVGTSTNTGTISIGGTAQTGTITLGSSSGTNTVAIGDGAGATTVNISNNNTGGAVNIGAGFTTGTISIGGTGLQTGTISVGSGTGAQIINLGNGSGAKTINIGGSGANVIGIANTQTAGSVSIGAAMTSGTVSIGGTGAQTGTIDLGVGTGAQAINLGTGGTAAKTVTIGNSSVAGSTTTIQGGSTSGVLVKADGANAFRIQNTAGSVTALTADTSATPKITIGAATGTLANRNLEVALVDVTTTIRMGNGTNGISYNDTATGTSGKLRYYGTARNSKTVTLVPEFQGAVLTGDGTNNTGTMTSDFCGNDGAGLFPDVNPTVCANSDFHNYYSWTAQATNDYDVWTRWQVPSDFSSFDSTPIQFYGWRTSSSAGTSVTLTIYNPSGSVCGTATNIANTNTWALTTYTSSGCTPTAGQVLMFKVSLSVGVNNEFARIGEINVNYLSNF